MSSGPAVQVVIGAGSNVEPQRHLPMAIAALADRYGRLRCSSIYRSAAVGFDGADFLNLVLALHTTDSAEEITDELERLHDQAGRDRERETLASRTLDLDLLLYGDQVIESPRVKVPRGDILDYAFVLAPLAELLPDLRHPTAGETMQDLWAGFDGDGQPLERVGEMRF